MLSNQIGPQGETMGELMGEFELQSYCFVHRRIFMVDVK